MNRKFDKHFFVSLVTSALYQNEISRIFHDILSRINIIFVASVITSIENDNVHP